MKVKNFLFLGIATIALASCTNGTTTTTPTLNPTNVTTVTNSGLTSTTTTHTTTTNSTTSTPLTSQKVIANVVDALKAKHSYTESTDANTNEAGKINLRTITNQAPVHRSVSGNYLMSGQTGSLVSVNFTENGSLTQAAIRDEIQKNLEAQGLKKSYSLTLGYDNNRVNNIFTGNGIVCSLDEQNNKNSVEFGCADEQAEFQKEFLDGVVAKIPNTTKNTIVTDIITAKGADNYENISVKVGDLSNTSGHFERLYRAK